MGAYGMPHYTAFYLPAPRAPARKVKIILRRHIFSIKAERDHEYY